jgi:prolipoprotein diacylglyceryltransferase
MIADWIVYACTFWMLFLLAGTAARNFRDEAGKVLFLIISTFVPMVVIGGRIFGWW